jgi:hypothetical protein
MIKKQLSEEKGISFTEIAKRAFEIHKPELALKLLECEKSFYKRVPFLLWMAKETESDMEKHISHFKRALSDSILSR